MNNILIHHGILGQKWGVRRYQNPDGSLTPAGRKRLHSLYDKEGYLTPKGQIYSDYIRKAVSRKELEKDISDRWDINNMDKQEKIILKELARKEEHDEYMALSEKGRIFAEALMSSKDFNSKHYGPMSFNELIEDDNKGYYQDIKSKINNPITKFNGDEIGNRAEAEIKNKVSNAKKTGNYDMEFLEGGYDVDERTGESLQGKALDDAYEKYLRNK